MDLEDFRHGGTNITALRLVDPENPLVKQVIQDWAFNNERLSRDIKIPNTSASTPAVPTLSSASLTVRYFI